MCVYARVHLWVVFCLFEGSSCCFFCCEFLVTFAESSFGYLFWECLLGFKQSHVCQTLIKIPKETTQDTGIPHTLLSDKNGNKRHSQGRAPQPG